MKSSALPQAVDNLLGLEPGAELTRKILSENTGRSSSGLARLLAVPFEGPGVRYADCCSGCQNPVA